MHTRFVLLAAASLIGASLVSADRPFFNDLDSFNRGLSGPFPNQTFRSSDVVAPLFQVNTFKPDLVDDTGYIFLTAEFGGKGGPLIFSSKDLSLVYADLNYSRSFDARAQDRDGFMYLTFIENGDCHVFNNSYEKQFTVTAKGLGRTTRADLHEFQFTDQGTAIVSVYQDIKYNLTALGAEDDGLLTDAVFEEVELETNEVLNLWRASNHFPLNDTLVKYGPDKGFMGSDGFDWFHINSIYKSRFGDYLISSQALSMIALLDGETGKPKWVLGGRNNQFKDLSGGNATKFANQHNARFVQRNESRVSFFDNHVLETRPCHHSNCSRGVVVELDYESMTVRLLDEFYHPQKVSSGSEGSVQALKNGNFLVGWGLNPGFTEHLPNGTIVMDVQQGPFASAAGLELNLNLTNGNTEVDNWEVYASNDPTNITASHRQVGKSARMGFETAIILDGERIPRYVKAFALDKHGEIQGLTASIDIPSQSDKEQDGSKNSEERAPKDGESTPVKEPGPLARRLEEATEEALFTGGRAGRRAIEDAGFSKELKEKLLSKIADANFKTQYSGAFTEANIPAAAGEGTRHTAAGQPWTGEEPIGDGVLRMLDDARKPLGPGLRGKFQPPPVDMRLQRGPSKSAGEKVATARDRASMYTGMDLKNKNGLTEEEREAYRNELKERFSPGFRSMPNTISGLAGLANEKIENAIARGQFKNIPRGTGVQRDARADNPFIDTTEYIMNKMIQRQDLVPPWIEKQQELVKAVRIFRGRLRNDWKRHAARMISSKGGSLQDQMRRAEAYAVAEQVHNPKVRGVGKQTGITTAVASDTAEESNKITARQTDKATPSEYETLTSVEASTTPAPSPGMSSERPPPPFRDAAWEQAEKSYLGLAVEQLNRLTRSYNLMAPDLAKKGYYSVDRELRACFADVAPEVAREIQVRALGGTVRSRGLRGALLEGSRDGESIGDGGGDGGIPKHLSGGTKVKVHAEAEEKAFGLKEWWRYVWKKD
ncbi:ASST-domain-containing protein [Dactylonectria estremocensis]|uniref:ASST-domain-containing protein n=1 Tax=Dactylonectria estremocensis TaxID=1079267 RepID=A0A9P9EC68_9HYPO|nr:ASST-domain-containing protein [Dactylonectria estremocensis]